MLNVDEIKKKILKILEQKGPSLPVHIARETELSPTFASAILSELSDERKVSLSNLRVGSSPLYFLPRQEQKLEAHADNLTGVEKSAFLKLKITKILQDDKQEPAMRVALRSIKDFAIPFRYQNQIFWKYAFIPDEEIEKLLGKKITTPPTKTGKKIESIFKKPKIKIKKQNFLEEVKQFLISKNIQLISLEQSDRKKIEARVSINSQQYFLTAFNKKRLTEPELIKTYKKALELSLRYYIILKAEPTKKMQEASRAYKNLFKIDNLI